MLLVCNSIGATGSCNLNKLKLKGNELLKKSVQASSVYTRMIRFFNYRNKTKLRLGINKTLVYKGLELHNNADTLYLSIDRTNWQLGEQAVNLLCIGLVLQNRKFIPLITESLDKKGNSNQVERIDLLDQLLALNKELCSQRICLLGDREFIGKTWFNALKKAGIDFIIRCRQGDYFQDVQKHNNIFSWELEKTIMKGIQRKKCYTTEVKLLGEIYHYHVQPNKKKSIKEPTITWISSISDPFQVSNGYGKRWQQEVFFGDIKTKRFDIESMNFKNLDKALMMLSLCALMYLCILIKGIETKLEKGYTRIFYDKKSKRYYPRKSVVQLGYEEYYRDVGFSIEALDRFIQDLYLYYAPVSSP